MLSESELESIYAAAAGDDPSRRWARGLHAVYEAGAAAERSRVVELAARRADEGYRLGESCDDIARDIRALATPAEPDVPECPSCGDPITDGSGVYVRTDGAWRHEDCFPEPDDAGREETR